MPVGAYQGTFTVGAAVGGFDVIMEGFGGGVQADATVRRVPWTQTNTVVVQSSGRQPTTRTYRAVVYTWADWIVISGDTVTPGLVGHIGALVVGAPDLRDSVAQAFLNSVELGSVRTIEAGLLTKVEFTMNFTFLE